MGSFLGGAASSKVNRTFHTFVTGTALVTLGVGLLSTVSSSLEVDKKIYGFEVIAGFGIGLTFSTVSLMTTKETEVEDHGMCSTIHIRQPNLIYELKLFLQNSSCRSGNSISSTRIRREHRRRRGKRHAPPRSTDSPGRDLVQRADPRASGVPDHHRDSQPDPERCRSRCVRICVQSNHADLRLYGMRGLRGVFVHDPAHSG